MAVRLIYDDREYVRAPGETLETDLGVLEIPADATPGDALETHLGHEFQIRTLRGPDCFEHFERTGAPMLPRDIGLVLGETGASSGDRILDAGTGTGVLAAYLGMAGASVLTYEQNPTAADVARENLAMVDLNDRVEVRTGDIVDAIAADDLGPFDVVTLDTAAAPSVIDEAGSLLVPGGYLAVYTPFVEDAREVVERARNVLEDVRSIETIQRTLDVDERGTRPSTRPVGHTGYLMIARRP